MQKTPHKLYHSCIHTQDIATIKAENITKAPKCSNTKRKTAENQKDTAKRSVAA